MAIIMDNLPLNIFDSSKHISQALSQYVNPHLRLPNYQAITKKWLDQCYDVTKQQVTHLIEGQEYLNFISDESSNIRRERVLNLCVHVSEFGAFYLQSRTIGSQRLDSRTLADWLISSMTNIARSDNSVINSLITDTCNTQRAVGNYLTIDLSPNHRTFWVPCDSHGLQLLVKDVICLDMFGKLMEQAQELVVAFMTSHKQLAALRELMMRHYDKAFSLALSVITRWGTQLALLSSTLRAKVAIIEFFNDLPRDISKSFIALKPIVSDPIFWRRLELLKCILMPIDEAIKMSETTKSTVCHVISRWKGIHKGIQEAIYASKEDSGIKVSLVAQFGELFTNRFNIQTCHLHYTAYMINPQTIGDDSIFLVPRNDIWEAIHRWLLKYVPGDPIEAENGLGIGQTSTSYGGDRAFTQLLAMRRRQGLWHRNSHIWRLSNDRIAFWNRASAFAPELAAIAMRLSRTPATSVPSERAFSTLNLMLSKLRNRLRSDRVDKLQYIFINERVLRSLSINSLSEEDKLQLEDALICIGEDHNTNPGLNGGKFISFDELEADSDGVGEASP